MTKECHAILPQRTVAAFGRNNVAYKAAHLISISLFVIKSAPILVTRTHQPTVAAAAAAHTESVCQNMGTESIPKREIKKSVRPKGRKNI